MLTATPGRPSPALLRPPLCGRPGLDLSVYLVTDTALCGQVGVAATVAAAVAAGVTAVQVRDRAATDDEFVALGRTVRAVLVGTGVRLLVNDRVHLVDAIGADGAHIGQLDLDVRAARAVLGDTAYLGLSVQDPSHVAAARAFGLGAIDYLGVGPVWRSSSKRDQTPPGGLGRLRLIGALSPWPCVAIGGITADRVPRLRDCGAVGVAVISAICGQPDVAAATSWLRRSWDGGTS